MGANSFLSPWYYATAYYILFLLLTWMTVLYYVGSNKQKVLYSEGSPMQGVALLMTLAITFFLGLRPNSPIFGDMGMYRHTYNYYILEYSPVNLNTEWLWDNLMFFCKSIGFNHFEFFLTVEFGYFFGMLICAFLLMRRNLWIAMLFFCTAFSSYSYGTNGIRNGLSCSIELVGIALLCQGRTKRVGALILMFLAFSIHRSIMLPTAAAIASVYFIKDTKTALRFWIASIFISLAAGPLVESFFAALGFDDRMSQYSSTNATEQSQSQFTQTGFRWDFLFYSMFPVIFTWYLTQRRRFNDSVFNIIANTYILCNAFWIMVIRSSFSNRFAYLSWFIYPIVIAYPLLRMNIWKDQDRRTALILFFYSGFTFFMFFVYYFGTGEGFRGFNQYWWRD
jgi:hypothetical protein